LPQVGDDFPIARVVPAQQKIGKPLIFIGLMKITAIKNPDFAIVCYSYL
jgi:hypothetical protein